MCAKSLEAAKHIEKLIATNPESASSFKERVLVGGMLSSELHLSEEDIDLIMSDPSLPSVLPDMVFSFRSLWKPKACFTEKENMWFCWIMPMSSMFAK